jgi:hypothetical protein
MFADIGAAIGFTDAIGTVPTGGTVTVGIAMAGIVAGTIMDGAITAGIGGIARAFSDWMESSDREETTQNK